MCQVILGLGGVPTQPRSVANATEYLEELEWEKTQILKARQLNSFDVPVVTSGVIASLHPIWAVRSFLPFFLPSFLSFFLSFFLSLHAFSDPREISG
jgi:hypothetical protein